MGLTRPTVAQLNTVITEISDPITLLNKGATQANVDVGFVLNRDGGISSNVAIYWNETTDSLVTAYTTSTGGISSNVVLTSYANLTTGNILAAGNVTATRGWGGTLSSAGVLGGIPIAFSAERSGAGTAGGIMSHGNGSTTGKGLRMPFAGKLIAGTMFGANVNGTLTIDAYLNGTANASYRFSQTGSLTDVGETKNFSSAPLTFAAGDTLGWYQTAVPTTANAYTVTFFVTYN